MVEEESSESDSDEANAGGEAADEASSESEADTVEVAAASEFDYGDYILTQNRYLNFEKDGKLSRQEPRVAEAAKPAESTGSFLGAVASIFLGVSSESSPTIEEQPAAWIAIRQQGDSLQIGVLEDEVLNYVAAVRFIDDDHAEFKWYYGEVGGLRWDNALTSVSLKPHRARPRLARANSVMCLAVFMTRKTTEKAVEAASEPASSEGTK